VGSPNLGYNTHIKNVSTGFYMANAIWDSHMGSIWNPYVYSIWNVHIDSIWNPYGSPICMISIWVSYGFAIGDWAYI